MHMYVQIFVTWYTCTMKNYVHVYYELCTYINFFQNLIVLKHKAYLIYSKLLSFTASNSSL